MQLLERLDMQKLSKYFGVISIAYIFLVVVETVVKLFQISRVNSSKVTTLLGITIDNKISNHEISTTFGLTSKLLLMYFIFLTVVYIIIYIVRKIKN